MRYCRRTKSNMPDQSKSTGEVSTQAGSKRTCRPARRNWFEATRSSLSIPSQASWIREPLERLAANGPRSAPDQCRCESRPKTAITLQLIAADQVVGHGRPLGNEPAVAGGRPDLRQVVLVDRRTDPDTVSAGCRNRRRPDGGFPAASRPSPCGDYGPFDRSLGLARRPAAGLASAGRRPSPGGSPGKPGRRRLRR